MRKDGLMNEVRDFGSSTYTVESDADKRLLVIRYRGRVVPGDVAACAEKVANALAKMPSGFRLLVDLTALESMDVACVPHLERDHATLRRERGQRRHPGGARHAP